MSQTFAFLLGLLFTLPVFTLGQEQGIVFARKGVLSPFLQGEFRALVIRNDAYRDPEGFWRPLKTAGNGALPASLIGTGLATLDFQGGDDG